MGKSGHSEINQKHGNTRESRVLFCNCSATAVLCWICLLTCFKGTLTICLRSKVYCLQKRAM